MKKKFLALSIGVGLLTASCLGPNKLFNDLHDWNMEVSENDAVNELVFLGFTIFPVYSIAYFIDIVVLNTVDYWSGDE